jgi:hypothetical protein
MKKQPKSYGMFTTAGDEVIGRLIDFARKYRLNEEQTMAILYDIAAAPKYPEASDTAVREAVGEELGFYVDKYSLT